MLCSLSKTDPRFPKYPSLPVGSCSGYITSRNPPSQHSAV